MTDTDDTTDTTTGEPAALTDGDRLLIACLLAHPTIAAAAKAANVSDRTIYRRLRSATFKAALTDARGGKLREDGQPARDQMRASIDRLVQLRDGAKHESTRLRAAQALLDLALKLNDVVEVAPKIAALEAALGDREQGE